MIFSKYLIKTCSLIDSSKLAANNKENEELFQELQEIKSDIKEVKNFLIFPRGVKKRGTGGNAYPKIINLEISEKKLTAQLGDDRELIKGVSADKLKKYEIWEGDEIYFPNIDEVLGIEAFIYGFDAPSRPHSCPWSPTRKNPILVREKTDTKSPDEIKVKKIKGRVAEEEQNEIERIIRKNKKLFLRYCQKCKDPIEEGKEIKVSKGSNYHSSRYSSGPRDFYTYYLCPKCYQQQQEEIQAKNKKSWQQVG
ncbi:39213_t:CDS:2 [Gigaspora margarita]|uniref:39213_t:CDS:1 n=1 Tax=Gigaspora margarita TaxID=4874 RepID=A0ABN7UAX0_GIGMA|nr:39213_t:CDS:2 [Gigaspora margarita]